jgi:hypothetical protein
MVGEDRPRVVGRWRIQVGALFREMLNGLNAGAFIPADGIEKGPEARSGGIGDKEGVKEWR